MFYQLFFSYLVYFNIAITYLIALFVRFHIISFLNSCVNPVALYCVSGVFRQHFHHYLCCRKASIPNRLMGHSTATVAGDANTMMSTIRRNNTYHGAAHHHHHHGGGGGRGSVAVGNGNDNGSPTQSIVFSENR